MPQRGALACAGPHRQCCCGGLARAGARGGGGPHRASCGISQRGSVGRILFGSWVAMQTFCHYAGLLYLYETRRPAT